MALVLSRIRPGSAPLRGPLQHSDGKTLRQRLAWRLKAEHLPLYLGAGLAIGLVGIGVNALLFQHERRPAPLFGSLVAPFSSPAQPPAAPAVPKPPSAEREAPAAPPPVALPPARPAEAAEGSPSDPITDLLRGEFSRRWGASDSVRADRAGQTGLPGQAGRERRSRDPTGGAGFPARPWFADFDRDHSPTCQTTHRGRARRGTLNRLRLRSDIWVAAYLRRCGVEGASAVLRRRGAAEAGAIFIKVDHLNGTATLYGPAPQSAAVELKPGVERIFARAHNPDSIDAGEAEERLKREIAFDPDVWIVEVEKGAPGAWLDLAS